MTPAELERYADAITKASLGLKKGDTFVVSAEPEHRELAVALARSAYRIGAKVVEIAYREQLLVRARIELGKDGALGTLPPWSLQKFNNELTKPRAAIAHIAGDTAKGFLDGLPPKRIAADFAGTAKLMKPYQRASLDMKARWTIAGWPTDFWAKQVYPSLSAESAKRKLAQDLLSFCRLTAKDGKGAAGWRAHVRALARRGERLTKLDLASVELRGPGTSLDVRLASGTRWRGGRTVMPNGVEVTANMPTEENFTSPHADGAEGTFTCTFPLNFQGRLIDGLRGEFRGGKLVRLEAKRAKDRDFVAAYIDSDATGHGRRLGELALVDSTSRIGRAKRTYFSTLYDENAATHIAFGAGFGETRSTKPPRNLNNSTVHLDVMIGSPELEVTGVTARGRRVPLIVDGLWQI